MAGKLIDKLQNDLAHLRKAFNERISYVARTPISYKP